MHTFFNVIFYIVGATIFVVFFGMLIYMCYRMRQGGAWNTQSWHRVTTMSSPVIVTSATHTTPGPGGFPVSVQNTPGGGYQATPYPTSMPMPQATGNYNNPPYPTHQFGAQPMPQPAPYPPAQPGFTADVTPYPPVGGINQSQVNPPSYDQVVATDTFAKQSPYNPNYVN